MNMMMTKKMNDSGYVYDNTPIYVEVDNELQFDLTVETESYECLQTNEHQN